MTSERDVADRRQTEGAGGFLPGVYPYAVMCKTCLGPIEAPRKVYCSAECKTRFRNGRTKRIPAICIMCSKSFMSRLQSVRAGLGKCCSPQCATEHVRSAGILAGPNHPKFIDGSTMLVHHKWPEKTLARLAVKREVRGGRMTRQPCERCGTTKRVHAHHDDYSKPLDVRWLCATDHAAVHKELREAGATP